MPDQTAVDSALGYYYQGSYALVVLLDAADGARVSLETADDIELIGSGAPRLLQLKHSSGQPTNLTISNVGFWKAVGNWCSAEATADLLFVTCASIGLNSSLKVLVPAAGRRDLDGVSAELVAEAERVRDEREARRSTGSTLPHAGRGQHCEAFCALDPIAQLNLIRRIIVLANSPNLAGFEDEIDLRLSVVVEPTVREVVRARLVEWWDYRISRSLISVGDRWIAKIELQRRLQELIRESGPDALPDAYSTRTPEDPDVLFAATMARQIDLVGGGSHRKRVAGLARWRALQQRAEWLDLDPSLAIELGSYDELLWERWQELFGPMCDDCCGLDEATQQQCGKDLLDWALTSASRHIEPIRSTWVRPYLVQGTFQELAERTQIGWHPGYVVALGSDELTVADDSEPDRAGAFDGDA